MTPSHPKVALVTGAARGIGLATAKKFLAEGWHVALLDIEGELLGRAVADIGQSEATLALTCDVSEAVAVNDAMEAVERRFGRLDALVNNAGIAVFAPLMETSETDWRRVLEVNLTGPFLCTKAAVPLMREGHGGAIVNITSISAVRASTLRSAYGTSKAGLAHLTKQLAVEARLAQHPRQRGRARPRRHGDGEAGAHQGNSRRLSRRDSAQPLRPRGGTCGGDLLPVFCQCQLHHRTNFGR